MLYMATHLMLVRLHCCIAAQSALIAAHSRYGSSPKVQRAAADAPPTSIGAGPFAAAAGASSCGRRGKRHCGSVASSTSAVLVGRAAESARWGFQVYLPAFHSNVSAMQRRASSRRAC